MELPRGWSPPQEVRAPLRIPPSIQRPCDQPERLTPRRPEEPVDSQPTLRRWKRLMLMYIIPVCQAMAWQLTVILGCLALFLLGLTLLKLLRL
jgi:hypothetical protein